MRFFLLLGLSIISQSFTLLLAENEKISMDQIINAKFEPIANTALNVIFYALPVDQLTLETKENVKLSGLSIKIDRSEVNDKEFSLHVKASKPEQVEVFNHLTMNSIKEVLAKESKYIEVKGEVPSDRPIGKWISGQNQFVPMSFDEKTKSSEIAIACQLSVPFILLWLVIAAAIFTLTFRFVNVRYFSLAIKTIQGKFSSPTDKGEVTHFQALTAALSGTVGLGNIAGVAVAIQIGGPGATFWMIVAGILGMSSKFVECTLGVKYRNIDPDGRVLGGPMLYLEKGFKERGLGALGKILAVSFSVFCIGGAIGGGNMFQVNAAYSQFSSQTGLLVDQGWIFGLILAVLVGLVIIGGIRSIARTTAKIVPFMCGIYLLGALVILVVNFGQIPYALSLIFTEAFSTSAVSGGILGAFIQGIKRAAFSNEAGVGSAPIAHSAVKTNHPASEGLVSLLEPFIDTVIVCTMTALVIIMTNQHLNPDLSGVPLTSKAFESVIPHFSYVLMIAVILFAISTMISWSYYGQQSWGYLFGRGPIKDMTFKLIFCAFIIIGASSQMGNVIGFSDAMIFAMALPNIIGLYVLMPVVKKELALYLVHVNNHKTRPD